MWYNIYICISINNLKTGPFGQVLINRAERNTMNNIENFRKEILKLNSSKLSSVLSVDGCLKFISEIQPKKLVLPAGWDIRKKVGNTFEFFNSENTMTFEVRQVHHSTSWQPSTFSW